VISNNCISPKIPSNNRKNLSFEGINAGKRIYLCKDSPVSKEFVAEITREINSLGILGAKVIKKQQIEFVLAQKATHAFPHLKDAKIPGTNDKATYDDSSAIAMFVKKGKRFASIIGFFEDPKTGIKASNHEVLHELGHQISYMFINIIKMFFSETKGYTKAYLKDIKALPENFKKHGINIKDAEYYVNCLVQESTPKSADKHGKEETFAEIFAYLKRTKPLNPYSKGMDQLIVKLFPNSTEYVKKLLRLLDKK